MIYDLRLDGRVLLSRIVLRRGAWSGSYLDAQQLTAETSGLDVPLLKVTSLIGLLRPDRDAADDERVLDQLRGLYFHKLRWQPEVMGTRRLLLPRTRRAWPYVAVAAARSRAARSARLRRLLGRPALHGPRQDGTAHAG